MDACPTGTRSTETMLNYCSFELAVQILNSKLLGEATMFLVLETSQPMLGAVRMVCHEELETRCGAHNVPCGMAKNGFKLCCSSSGCCYNWNQ